MIGRLFLLFTLVPLVELYLLIWLAGFIGFWPTLAIVMTTAGLGAFFAKREGLKVLRAWQTALSELRVPEEGLTSALLVLAAGIFLITPGVLTDLAGLLLLLPAVRRRVAGLIERRFFPGGVMTTGSFSQAVGGIGGMPRGVRVETFHVSGFGAAAPPRVEVVDHGPRAPSEEPVLDADVVVDRRGRILHRT
jgi:UPF0716 protein FxsA